MRADVNTPTAVQAVIGKNDRGTLRITLERRADDLGFGADSKTIPAVGALLPTCSLYSEDGNKAQQTVHCAHRADMPAPSTPQHKNIKNKNCRDQGPAHPHTEQHTPLEHSHRVEPFPDNRSAQSRQEKNGCHKPIASTFVQLQTLFQPQPPVQPSRRISQQIDRADPGAKKRRRRSRHRKPPQSVRR